jgi:hypothetical protein
VNEHARKIFFKGSRGGAGSRTGCVTSKAVNKQNHEIGLSSWVWVDGAGYYTDGYGLEQYKRVAAC